MKKVLIITAILISVLLLTAFISLKQLMGHDNRGLLSLMLMVPAPNTNELNEFDYNLMERILRERYIIGSNISDVDSFVQSAGGECHQDIDPAVLSCRVPVMYAMCISEWAEIKVDYINNRVFTISVEKGWDGC